ncbi:MAG: hypothetical protein HY787_16890 [Deltaproteobacteria bacterium]|nr:hypothetical protein [Deltaproteobacteria bacterium]
MTEQPIGRMPYTDLKQETSKGGRVESGNPGRWYWFPAFTGTTSGPPTPDEDIRGQASRG